MANLPEKNITTVDKVTSIPSNANLYINANGEFRQATVDDVLKASPVIADSIANQYKNASGSPILLTDSAKGVAIDFEVKGRSIQDGEPTPDNPITPKSVGDMGYFDGELLQGAYAGSTGAWGSTNNYVCSRNMIPCKAGDKIKLEYAEKISQLMILFYDSNKNFISYSSLLSVSELEVNAVENACYFNININNADGITPQTAKHICVTINDKYALIVDSVGENLWSSGDVSGTKYKEVMVDIDKGTYTISALVTSSGTDATNSSIHFFNESGVDFLQIYLTRGVRASKTFNLSEKAVKCWFLAESIYANSDNDTFGYTDIQLESGEKVTDYEPYIHSRKYIPISAPLRGIGEVTDVASLSECEVDRKYTEVVFDGSADENWSLKTIGCELYLNNTNSGNALCTHYKKNNGVSWGDLQGNEFNIIGTVLRIKDNTHQSTLDEWKSWLQSNPITVIYELAEPTTESIEPIDIDTFEGVTQISVSDNAEMEVEYPTSKVAGIASIGWSKGRRAEYDLEQLKAQMLALQTTIVSSI